MFFAGDNAKRGGFTLVEIMIAIAILGILAVIAATNFGGMNEKYKVEAETKQLYADLMDARGRAMQRNRVFLAQINVNGYQTYEDTDPAPDGDGHWTEHGHAGRQRRQSPCDHHATAGLFEFSTSTGTASPPSRGYPVLVDRKTRLQLHHDPSDEDQDGTVHRGGRLRRKITVGMTLVEVLVAMAIVFIIFLGMSSAGLVVLDQNIKNSQRDEAVGVAEMEMQQVRNTPFNDHHAGIRQRFRADR